jgi:hypothetical protein
MLEASGNWRFFPQRMVIGGVELNRIAGRGVIQGAVVRRGNIVRWPEEPAAGSEPNAAA